MELDTDTLDMPSNTSTSTLTDSNKRVLAYIGSTFNTIIAALEMEPHEKLQIKLKRITSLVSSSGGLQDTSIAGSCCRIKSREMKYCWPGSTAEESWRFGMVIPHSSGTD